MLRLAAPPIFGRTIFAPKQLRPKTAPPVFGRTDLGQKTIFGRTNLRVKSAAKNAAKKNWPHSCGPK